MGVWNWKTISPLSRESSTSTDNSNVSPTCVPPPLPTSQSRFSTTADCAPDWSPCPFRWARRSSWATWTWCPALERWSAPTGCSARRQGTCTTTQPCRPCSARLSCPPARRTSRRPRKETWTKIIFLSIMCSPLTKKRNPYKKDAN